jgi:hypothetical protein
MRHEVFCLCDAATEFQGKLNVLGTFDTMFTPQVPVIYPGCSIAIRLRVEQAEQGQHAFRLSFIDEDGRDVIAPIGGSFGVNMAPGVPNVAVNLVINLQGTRLLRHGNHRIDLTVDNQLLCTLPVFVRPPEPQHR